MAGEAKAKPDAAKAKPGVADGEADGVFSRLSELAWQALPALGSAAGFVGFVAVIGAAIEWVRFRAAHLPATQAVLVVPKHEFVVIGALALAVFVAGGLMAVLLVYLIDNKGDATVGTVWGLVAVGVIEMFVTLFFIDKSDPGTYVYLGIWFVLIGVLMAGVVGEVMRFFRERTALRRAGEKVIAARDGLAAAQDALVPGGPVGPSGGSPPGGSHKTPPKPTPDKDPSPAKKEAGRAGAAEAAGGKAPSRSAKEKPETPDDAVQGAKDQAEIAYGLAWRTWERAIREWREVIKTFLPRHGQRELDRALRKIPAPHKAEALVSAFVLKRNLKDAEGELEGLDTALLRPIKKWLTSFHGVLKRTRVAFVVGVAVVLLVLVLLTVLRVAKDDSIAWVSVVLAIVVLLALMNVFVARATTKFAWYGVSVFFSVLLFGATLTLARSLHEPKAQPIALVRKSDDTAICGVYITETSSRVYIGRLELNARKTHTRRPGEIFWIPNSDIDLVSVGDLVRTNEKPPGVPFSKLAVKMLAQLYKDRAEEAAPSLKNTTTTEVKGPEPAGDTKAKTTTTVEETPPPRYAPVRHLPVKAPPKGCTEQPSPAKGLPAEEKPDP
jgi:uncharacterized membrane protein